MIELTGVTKRYRPGEPPALSDVSLRVAPGEVVALLGRSGAGKSTLIRCINGLVRPDSGQVVVGGAAVTAARGADLRQVRRRIGVIFQEYHLIERYSVQTNALSGAFGRYAFWQNMLGLWSPADRQRADDLIDRVGLKEFAQASVRDLSGGQRQRVAVARAMMQQPSVLLGDEPVSSLDPVTALGILQLIAGLAAEANLTVLLSLHDMALARQFCQRAVGLSGGRVVFDGPMSALTAEGLAEIYAGPAAAAATAPAFSREAAGG